MLSNLSGTWLTDAEATDPAYWAKHLRNAVRFAADADITNGSGDVTASIAGRRSDIPDVTKDDAEVLKDLEASLKRVVFGQDTAIEALSSAIKLARAGLREPEKPIGSYMFTGPTGVGKTEVAKQLASIVMKRTYN